MCVCMRYRKAQTVIQAVFISNIIIAHLVNLFKHDVHCPFELVLCALSSKPELHLVAYENA